jgi:hypothetical protein
MTCMARKSVYFDAKDKEVDTEEKDGTAFE